MFPVFNPSFIWFQKSGSCEDAKIGTFVLLQMFTSMCINLVSKDWQMVGAIKAKTTTALRSPVERRGGRKWMG